MILLTTSRRPTGRIRALCRDLANSIPDIMRINRGKMSQDRIAEKAIELEAHHIMTVDCWHGGLGKINFFQASSTGLKPIPPLLLLSGIRLRREFEKGTRLTKSSVITMEPKASPEMKKMAENLSKYFRFPIQPFYEASENHRVSMHLSLDNSKHIQITFLLLERIVEIGPRITLSKLIWEVES